MLKAVLKNLPGIGGGLNFRLHRAEAKGMKPTFLVLQVTANCNSRCRMCGLWKSRMRNELSAGELRELLSSPLFSRLRFVNITGGEPFMRKDIGEIARAFLDECPHLELIAVPTNGFVTNLTLGRAEDMLKVLRKPGPKGKKVLLSITVSIDGIGPLQTEIRGIESGYAKNLATVEGLKTLQGRYDNLEVGTETCVTRFNSKHLGAIYRELKPLTGHVNFTPALTSDYYGTKDDDSLFRKVDADRLLRFYRRIRMKEPAYAYYFQKVEDIYRRGRRTYPCLMGYKSMYLDSTGNVFPCHILGAAYRMGSVREKPIEEIWLGPASGKLRRRLNAERFCNRCTNNCDIINNLKEETIDFSAYIAKHPEIYRALSRELKAGRFARFA